MSLAPGHCQQPRAGNDPGAAGENPPAGESSEPVAFLPEGVPVPLPPQIRGEGVQPEVRRGGPGSGRVTKQLEKQEGSSGSNHIRGPLR